MMGGGKTARNYAQAWAARGRREKRRTERGEWSGRKENMCDKAKVEKGRRKRRLSNTGSARHEEA
jgi:hypothetical protein